MKFLELNKLKVNGNYLCFRPGCNDLEWYPWGILKIDRMLIISIGVTLVQVMNYNDFDNEGKCSLRTDWYNNKERYGSTAWGLRYII